jgi:PAS domain S-box-containing protein
MEDKIKSIITCDLDGKVETFSEGAEKIFGYTKKEVIGKKRVSDFSPGEVVLGHVVNWLKTSVEKGEWEGETVFLGKNNNEIPSKIKITPTKGKNGEHIGYCGVTSTLADKTPDEVRPKISFFHQNVQVDGDNETSFFECNLCTNFCWCSCRINAW